MKIYLKTVFAILLYPAIKYKIELLTGKILEYADLSIEYKEQVSNTASRIMEWWQSKNFNI